MRAVAAVCVAAAAVLAGCGGARKLPYPCNEKARAAMARAFAVTPDAVKSTRSVANNTMPQCIYANGRRRVVVNVDNGPQAYFRLERTAVEANQQFGVVRETPAPIQVPGIGLDADWFPAGEDLMTTDGVNLITVTVSWPGLGQGRRIALGKAAARAYLGKLKPPPGYG